jgi:hypothetical protein
MAILIDSRSEETATPLKLSIRWRRIFSNGYEWDRNGEMAIGLYIGDEPMFSPAVFDPDCMHRSELRPGEFYGESDYCKILRDIPRALKTGERTVTEDSICLFTRIVIGPDLLGPEPKADPEARFFGVLVIIDHGGKWHGDGVGSGGPAVLLGVTRAQLERFWRDLVAEAMDPAICDEVSQELLHVEFDASQ